MGFDLGTIRARVGLDGSDFVSGMTSMETASEIFGTRITQFVNNPLLGTIRIIKDSASAFAGLIAVTADHGREITQWSDRLGVSAETLSGLLPAVRRLGGEIEDLGDLFIQMSEKAYQAANGEGIGEVFDRLNVSVIDANENLRSNEVILRDVADGLAQVRSPTERMAIATELFSTAGEKLLPILSQGSRAIDEQIDRADKYGLVMRGYAAPAAKEMANRIDDIRDAINGVKQTSAIAFMEGFSKGIGGATDDVERLSKAIRNSLTPALEGLGEATGRIAQSDWLRDEIEGVTVLADLWLRAEVSADEYEGKQPRVGEGSEYEKLSAYWYHPIGKHIYNDALSRMDQGDTRFLGADREESIRLAQEAREAERARALGG